MSLACLGIPKQPVEVDPSLPATHCQQCRLCRQSVPDMKAGQAGFQQLLWMLRRYLDGMTSVTPPVTLSEGCPSVETTVRNEELAEAELL